MSMGDQSSSSIIDSVDKSTVIMGEQDDDDTLSSIGDDDITQVNTLPIPLSEGLTFLQKAKFYTSLCLGTTAILAVFGFLFLIPFVVEPAISTILADFSPNPVACVATQHIYAEGLKNCSWASCREGCTSAATRCHQIRVNYSKLNYDEFIKKPLGSVSWDVSDTKFFINTEGCGYPPRVNCSEFSKKFGYNNMGIIFPCYFSRTYPQTVVSRYSWDDNLRNLILALVTPIALFIISLAVLCYWYCPPMGKNCGNQNRSLIDKYSTKEDEIPLLLQHSCGRRIRRRRGRVLIVTAGTPPRTGVMPDDNISKNSNIFNISNINKLIGQY